MMPSELGYRIFFKFPVRDSTGFADTVEPLVSDPSGSPAVPGVVCQKCFIAVGCNDGICIMFFNIFYAMENPFS